MASHSVLSDFVGRVQNISLAPSAGNSLLPLFEAVTNSIQAIEDRFGPDKLGKGNISIDVFRDTDDGLIDGFAVRDNGIGLTPSNMTSFETSDSRYKAAKGGKGIGRFLWLKVFEHVHVESRFGSKQDDRLSFDFVLEEKDQIRNVTQSSELSSHGTSVTLKPFRSQYRSVCPKKTETVVSKLISHFLPYFINVNTPKILLHDDGVTDLFSSFTEAVSEDHEYSIDIDTSWGVEHFVFNCFLLPRNLSDDEKGTNAIFYGANGRSVLRRPIDNAIGMEAIEGQYAFFGYVSGKYLDEHVNQERTGISWQDELGDELQNQAIARTKEFLSRQILTIRERQTTVVRRLLAENLRFMTIVSDPADFANSLELSTQSSEDVFLELSRKSRREENRTRAEYATAKKNKSDIDADVKKYTEKLSKESLASLAEYVYKRKLILNAFEDKISFVDEDKKRYELEELVHELICPLKSTRDELNYEDHNLWVVDDQLAFYSYFNSDKTLTATTGRADPSTKEPDITFFDLGLGLDRSGTIDPVSIIEFKRPGRDDYRLADNPIVQIREYCSRLREAGRVVSHKGTELRALDSTTPFQGHIIADITPSLLEMMRQFGPYAQKAGHSCYYKWDNDYHMFIQIQSYADVLRGAKARNEAFFTKLGLTA